MLHVLPMRSRLRSGPAVLENWPSRALEPTPPQSLESNAGWLLLLTHLFGLDLLFDLWPLDPQTGVTHRAAYGHGGASEIPHFTALSSFARSSRRKGSNAFRAGHSCTLPACHRRGCFRTAGLSSMISFHRVSMVVFNKSAFSLSAILQVYQKSGIFIAHIHFIICEAVKENTSVARPFILVGRNTQIVAGDGGVGAATDHCFER